MALTFIGSDQPISAAKWNEFFAELDRKVSLIMDSKSLLLLPGRRSYDPLAGGFDPIARVLGSWFCFVRGAAPRSSFLGNSPAYDHAPFVEAAETLPVTLFDSAKKIVSIDDVVPSSFTDRVNMGPITVQSRFFDRSLEAHQRMFQEPDKAAALYWLFEPHVLPNYRPEKISHYAQAEIVIEGDGWADFQMATRWNKYQFFRFHNLTGYTVTVSFAGYHTLTVPRWESRCVRRTDVASGYLDGWNYFHRFKPGDPRVFEMPHGNMTPSGSMGSNNVISPTLVYPFLDLISGAFGGPRVYRDPHELYDVADLYSQFPVVTDATLLGDLLHHAGDLVGVQIDGAGVVTKRTFGFTSYGALLGGALASEGISVTSNPDGTLTLGTTLGVTHDLWGVGTNLLGKPMGNLNSGIEITTACPEALSVRPAIGVTGTDERAWTPPIDQSDGTVTLGEAITSAATLNTSALSTGEIGNSPNGIVISRWTIGDVKTLNPWGDPAYPGQDTAFGTFTGRTVTLTPFGLKLTFGQRIPVEFHPAWITGSIDLRDDTAHVDGTALVFERAISFDGYGWATTAIPAFIGPRKARVVSACPSDTVLFLPGNLTPDASYDPFSRHPSIAGQPQGADGADFDVIPYRRDTKRRDTTGISVLTPLSIAWPTDFGTWENPFDFQIYPADVLDEFDRDPTLAGYVAARARYLTNTPAARRAVRLNLLREHFNCLVNTVNALKRCSPFVWDMANPFFEGSLRGGFGFVPNTVGPFGGTVCPANQYASVEFNSDAYRFWESIGVPIKTEADLPASYATTKAVQSQSMNIRTSYHEQLTFAGNRVRRLYLGDGLIIDTIFPSFSGRVDIGATTASFAAVEDGAPSVLTSDLFGVAGAQETPFYWVTVEDVKAAIEGLGFKFLLERQCVPYLLKLFYVEPGPIEQLFVETPAIGSIDLGPFVFNAPGAELNESRALTHTTQVPAVWAQMIEAIEGETAEWIREVGVVRLLDHRAGDVDTVKLDVLHTWVLPLTSTENVGLTLGSTFFGVSRYGTEEYRLLRQRADIVRTTPFSIQVGAGEIEPVRRRASVLIQSWVSSPMVPSGTLILARSPWLSYNGEEFSRQSRVNALGRLQFGPQVIPLYAPGASVGAVAVALGAQQNFRSAAIEIGPPTPGTDPVTVDSTIIKIDSTIITADAADGTGETPGIVTRYAQDTLWVKDWPLSLA